MNESCYTYEALNIQDVSFIILQGFPSCFLDASNITLLCCLRFKELASRVVAEGGIYTSFMMQVASVVKMSLDCCTSCPLQPFSVLSPLRLMSSQLIKICLQVRLFICFLCFLCAGTHSGIHFVYVM